MDAVYQSTYKYLLGCGFSPVHRGFKLIIKAVQIICSEGSIPLKEIYSRLAKECGCTSAGVCKNIKNAIDYALLNCDIEIFENCFGLFGENGALTCGVFLYYTADKIKYCAPRC